MRTATTDGEPCARRDPAAPCGHTGASRRRCDTHGRGPVDCASSAVCYARKWAATATSAGSWPASRSIDRTRPRGTCLDSQSRGASAPQPNGPMVTRRGQSPRGATHSAAPPAPRHGQRRGGAAPRTAAVPHWNGCGRGCHARPIIGESRGCEGASPAWEEAGDPGCSLVRCPPSPPVDGALPSGSPRMVAAPPRVVAAVACLPGAWSARPPCWETGSLNPTALVARAARGDPGGDPRAATRRRAAPPRPVWIFQAAAAAARRDCGGGGRPYGGGHGKTPCVGPATPARPSASRQQHARRHSSGAPDSRGSGAHAGRPRRPRVARARAGARGSPPPCGLAGRPAARGRAPPGASCLPVPLPRPPLLLPAVPQRRGRPPDPSPLGLPS